jgi:hypothetical protein
MNEIVKAEETVGKFELAQRQAKAFASSSLVPQAYQGNVPNVMIAMEVAERIGASVFAVMQHLYVVHGKPAFDATFLIGTVNTCGRFTPIRYRLFGKTGEDDWGCRAVATDKETGEECVGPLVTIGMAKAEGWYQKTGSKWQTLPELMLHYRAAAFWSRVFAPDLSLGMHTTDEVADSVQVQSSVVRSIDALAEKLKSKNSTTKTIETTTEPTIHQEQPAPAEQNTPAGAFDPLGELYDLLKERYPDDYQKQLMSLCKKHGLAFSQLNADNAGELLDILNNEKDK